MMQPLQIAPKPGLSLDRWMSSVALADVAWLIRRHWRLLIFFGLLGLGAGIAFLKLFPDSYVSRAQVRFIPPQVNEKYVTPNVGMMAEQRIFALTQLINSRLTATKMIESFSLYPERRLFLTVADLVPRFQSELDLRQIGGGSQDAAMRTVPSLAISFRYSDRDTAQKVVRRIMELVYEENRRYRGDQSLGTTEFLQQQVKTVLDQMTALEERIATLPPPQTEGNFRNMVEAEELHDNERRLTDLKHQLRSVMLEQGLRRKSWEAQEAALRAHEAAKPSTDAAPRGDLIALRQRVADARLRYAAGHPDRLALEAALDKLEKEFAAADESEAKRGRENTRLLLAAGLSKTRAEWEGYETARLNLEKEAQELAHRVTVLRGSFRPVETNELDRLTLMREYQGLKDHYGELLKKQRESQVASDMERRGQGETVELIEPPTLPDSPEQPNWVVKTGGGWLAGTVLGLALVLLRFFLRPRVLSANHLPMVLDVPVIAELPAGSPLQLERPKRSRLERSIRLKKAVGSLAVLLVAVLVGVFATSCSRVVSEAELLRQARASVKAGNDNEASIFYRRVLQTNARHPEANAELAELHMRAGQTGLARERLIRAVELLPQRRDLLVQLTEISYQIYFADPGRPAALLREIEDAADKIIARWPGQADGYRLKGQALLERRRTEEAIELMEAATQRLPLDPALHAQLSTAHYQASDPDRAEEILRELVRRRPDYAPGADLLYLILMEQNRPADARTILEARWQQASTVDHALRLAAHDDAFGRRAQVETWLGQVSSQFANDSQAPARIGDFWLHRGVFASARTWFEKGRQNFPPQMAMYTGRLAEVHLAEKNPVAARRVIEAGLTHAPEDPLLRAYQSAMDLESGDRQRRATARTQLEAISARLPGSPFVRFHLGRAYLRDGDVMRAGQQLERCVALDPNYAPGWVALAEANFHAGRAGQANQVLQNVLQRAPTYTPALLLQAQMSLAAKRPADAEKSLERLLQGDPENPGALLALGQVKMTLGRLEQAEKLLEQARAGLPDNSAPLLLLAETRVLQGQTEAAVALLEKARAAAASDVNIRSALAGVAIRAGRPQMAIEEYTWLMAQRPSEHEYRLGLANALGLSGNTQRAAEEYKRVQAAAGQDARPWVSYGALLSQSGQEKEAAAAYKEAITRDKNNPFALNNLAYLMAKQRQDLQGALSYAEQAKRSLPRSLAINDTLAYIYLLMGMNRNAAAVYEEMMPDLPTTQRNETRQLIRELERGNTKTVLARVEAGVIQPRQP